MRVSFYVPRPSSMLVSNLLGVLGLVAVVVAIGLLAGWPWALLAAGLVCVGLCALAQNAAATVAAEVPAGASAGPPLKAVS
jgi:hypothetical protein